LRTILDAAAERVVHGRKITVFSRKQKSGLFQAALIKRRLGRREFSGKAIKDDELEANASMLESEKTKSLGKG